MRGGRKCVHEEPAKDVVLIVLLDFFPLSPATPPDIDFFHSQVILGWWRKEEGRKPMMTTESGDGEEKKKCREESQPTQTTPTNVLHTLFFSFFSSILSTASWQDGEALLAKRQQGEQGD